MSGLVLLPREQSLLFRVLGQGKRSFSPFFHVAAAPWNVNAGGHLVPGNFCEAPGEEDQELLLWQ